jgi:hypothetical protein
VAAGPVLAAHRAALAMLADPRDPVRRRLVAATDPVDRIAIALSGSDDALLATVLLDARAALPEDARPLVAGWLFGRLARKRPGLPGMVFETLAADMARLQALQECTEQVNSASPRYALAGKVAAAVATLRLAEAWIADALWLAYRENTLGDPDRVVTVGRKLMATLPRKGDG